MYAGLEGWIEGLNAIRCEEKDALEVLEEAEEDGHEGVAAYVLRLACLWQSALA